MVQEKIFAKEKRFIIIVLHSCLCPCRESRGKDTMTPERVDQPLRLSRGFFIPLSDRPGECSIISLEDARDRRDHIPGQHRELHPHHDRPAHISIYTERAKGDTSEAHCNEPSNTLSSRSDQYIRTEDEDHKSICSKILYPYNK